MTDFITPGGPKGAAGETRGHSEPLRYVNAVGMDHAPGKTIRAYGTCFQNSRQVPRNEFRGYKIPACLWHFFFDWKLSVIKQIRSSSAFWIYFYRPLFKEMQ